MAFLSADEEFVRIRSFFFYVLVSSAHLCAVTTG